MIAERIKVTPFQIEGIMKCEIVKKGNQHGRAFVKGYIPSGEEQDYLELAARRVTVQIQGVDEDGTSTVLFSGMVESCQIKNHNHVLVMELSLVSHTSLMDMKPQIRGFQIPGMPYKEVFDTIVGGYLGGGCILSVEKEAVTEEPLVQYNESDWEFFKRLASHLNTVVIPSYQTDGVKCYIGLPNWPGVTKVNPVSYTICKMVGESLYKEQNGIPGLIKDGELCYEIEELKVLDIGEKVEFQGRLYQVVESKSYLDGHQLWNTYLIQTGVEMQVPRMYNERMVGASLDGVVSEVNGARVRVKLRADAVEGKGKWFAFSTVYSSPGGSGWYCMPEVGDEIRLYFPTVKEKHGYVISAVHLAESGGGVGKNGNSRIKMAGGREVGGRSDPSYKVIQTKSNKIVLLNDTQIFLSNNNGMSILLDDHEGITITSGGNVNLRSGGKVELASPEGIEVTGSEEVTLMQGKGSITLSDSKILFDGAETKIQ